MTQQVHRRSLDSNSEFLPIELQASCVSENIPSSSVFFGRSWFVCLYVPLSYLKKGLRKCYRGTTISL
jgi:hypothetical protein